MWFPPSVQSIENEQAKAVLGKHLSNSLRNDKGDPEVALARGRAAASCLAQRPPGEDGESDVGGGVVHERLPTVDETTRAAQV
jgi:hypothetical protein